MSITAYGLLAFASLAELTSGYHTPALSYQGPGEWRRAAEPVWVWEYHTLKMRYRATGLRATDDAVLTLRPGTVGPVTPGANNPENPFAEGLPVVVAAARDLIADGAEHTLTVDLRSRMRTAQIDQLIFTLRTGERLEIADLDFTGDPALFPVQRGGPALPKDARALKISGTATTLRGRETIQIAGEGRRGRTLYLSLLMNLAGVTTFSPSAPFERCLAKETSETANLMARIRYADGTVEEQFPLNVAERRHAVANRTPGLYALEVDPRRTLASAELMDLSPHIQLALFAAGLSDAAPPAATDEVRTIPPADAQRAMTPPDLGASKWYELRDAGSKVSANLHVTSKSEGRYATLSLTNTDGSPRDFTLVFPSLDIRAATRADDVYYLFPQQSAVLSQAEQTLEGNYSGAFPLQFTDVFAPAANSGAAVIVNDTNARGKRFRLTKSGATVRVEVLYTVHLDAGETVRFPGVDVVFHGGDWRQGFDAYRRWTRSWYKPQGPRPAWLRTAFWARRDYPVGGSGELFDVRANRYTFDTLLRDAAPLGGADFIDISGWALSNATGRVGDYPIELGGAADLKRNIAAARVPTGLYFEGYLADKNSAVGRRAAPAWQIIDSTGKPKWWQGGAELFVCPYVADWQAYLSHRIADVAAATSAEAVYLDEYGFGHQNCYSTKHGHQPGAGTMEGELAMVRAVRRALDAAGRPNTALYIEETPPDAAAPYYDAAFCYALPMARVAPGEVKLNLWRFVFPDVRLWDMLSLGVHPRQLPAEDIRLSLWHGNGAWLKGHVETWYGEKNLALLRHSHELLKHHAAAFAGQAEPLVRSPHPTVLMNRFSGGGETVHTLFNTSYRTVHVKFRGHDITLAPRGVEVIADPGSLE